MKVWERGVPGGRSHSAQAQRWGQEWLCYGSGPRAGLRSERAQQGRHLWSWQECVVLPVSWEATGSRCSGCELMCSTFLAVPPAAWWDAERGSASRKTSWETVPAAQAGDNVARLWAVEVGEGVRGRSSGDGVWGPQVSPWFSRRLALGSDDRKAHDSSVAARDSHPVSRVSTGQFLLAAIAACLPY